MGGGSDLSEAADRMGLPAELLQESEGYKAVEIYPDNSATVSVFCDMATQWRVGPAGLTGMDYKALPVVLNMRGIKRDGREDLFDGLRVMERAVLNAASKS